MAEVDLNDAPRKARENFEKGLAAFERNNLDYAVDMFLLSLDLCPQLMKARKFLRAAEMKKLKGGKPNPLSKVLSTLKGSGTMMKAQSLLKKDPLKALRASEDLLRIDPTNLTFIGIHGQAAVAAGMPEVAIMTLEAIRDTFTKDVKTLRWLAKLYTDVNRTHDARQLFEEILSLRPNDPQALKELKDATAIDTMHKGQWESEGDFRSKVKDEKESIKLEQENKAVKSAKDITDLIAEQIRKIDVEPENINFKRALADLYSRANQFDDAIGVLQEAQRQTGGADPQIDRALSTIRIRKFDHDIKLLQDGGNAAAAESKKQERAAFLLTDAKDRVERYPNDLQFKYDLGVLLFERNELNEAIQLLQQSQKNPQRRTRSLYYLALCFKAKEQFDIAAEQLEKAASELHVMDEAKKDILYELGSIYDQVGKIDKAIEFFKDIYSVDIGYRDISSKIEAAYKKKSD